MSLTFIPASQADGIRPAPALFIRCFDNETHPHHKFVFLKNILTTILTELASFLSNTKHSFKNNFALKNITQKKKKETLL